MKQAHRTGEVLVGVFVLLTAVGSLSKAQDSVFDAAEFALVFTCDSERDDGCRSGRTEEFRTEDVFLETEIAAQRDRSYIVPAQRGGRGALGLRWVSGRRLKQLIVEFADANTMPAAEEGRAQYWGDSIEPLYGGQRWWKGRTFWQGKWVDLGTGIKAEGNKWIAAVDINEPIEKIRWIFPATSKPIRIRKLAALTDSQWDSGDFKIFFAEGQSGRPVRIGVGNGYILNSGLMLREIDWDTARAASITLRYVRPGGRLGDRTIVSFAIPAEANEAMPSHRVAIAIEDVLKYGYVYVRDYDLFMKPQDSAADVNEVARAIRSNKTILEKVREMPDQTLEAAFEKVHNPVQDKGHIRIGLACGNNGFIVEREGAVQFDTKPDEPAQFIYASLLYPYRFVPVYGQGGTNSVVRELYGGWLPVPVTTIENGGLIYRQRTFVAPFGPKRAQAHRWLQQQSLCVAEISVENPTDKALDASVGFAMTTQIEQYITHFNEGQKRYRNAGPKVVRKGIIFSEQNRLLAFVDTSGSKNLQIRAVDGNQARISGRLPGRTNTRCFVYIPGWDMEPAKYKVLNGGSELLSAVESYWQQVLAGATRIELPDQLLVNIIRASQVHCLLASRNEDAGKRFATWISSMSYGSFESEANPIIYGMDLMGHEDYAGRALEFYANHLTPEGFIKIGYGYTLMGTGWHLWTLGRHYKLTGDKDWLRGIAPQAAKACNWVERQVQKTKRHDPYGRALPEYGLVPPGVSADLNDYVYRFAMEGYYCAGLRATAQALTDINWPGAGKWVETGEELGESILRAYRWAQGQKGAQPLPNGSWAQSYPTGLYVWELNDGGLVYNVELGAHQLVAQEILDPYSPETSAMITNMEDVAFLASGEGDYPAERNRADWFSLGGFSKFQPYYTRIAHIYVLRDEVKPFIRSYFNTIPSLISLETLSFWEGFNNGCAWNKTHETGYFLQQSRMMLVMERGEELWLAPFVTCNWMKPGMVVAMTGAPTNFGPVSYRITSQADKGYIEATIEPPSRRKPKAVVIRLRHPEKKRMKAVTVNGAAHGDFDAEKEYVRLENCTGTTVVRAEY